MAEFITLECPSCGGRTDFAADASQLICEYCGDQHVFNLPVENKTAGPPQPFPGNRRSIARPKQVKIEKHGQELEISWRWYSARYVGLAFFCLIWDGFLCFWYGLALSMEGTPRIMFVFPLVHLALGLGLTYFTAAGLFNTSTLRITPSTLSVQHDPLPWIGEVKIPVPDIDQLYTEEFQSSRNKSGPTYILYVLTWDERKIKLLSNLDAPDVGVFIETQVESWLNLPDEPVAGEVRR